MKKLISVLAASLGLLISGPAASEQNCPDSLERTQPTERYVIHNDGTVTDKRTGLMWMRCTLGQDLSSNTCTNTGAKSHTWIKALDAALEANKEGGTLGYTDWRLPSVVELASITDPSCRNPAINVEVFPNTDSTWYWSSSARTLHNSYSQYAWYVEFMEGLAYTERNHFNANVRLVRDYQP